ncbi:MAG: EamA family transporter, partial [Candidatus Thorarchaeota archaeon]
VVGVTIFFASIFYVRTLSLATASYMTMMSMMTPVFVVVGGFLWLNETMNPFQIVGAAVILASGILIHELNI